MYQALNTLRAAIIVCLAVANTSASATSQSSSTRENSAHKASELQQDQAQANLSTGSIRRIQRELSESGHEVTESGKLDESTVNAIQNFQRSEGLGVNGQLNDETLRALGYARREDMRRPDLSVLTPLESNVAIK